MAPDGTVDFGEIRSEIAQEIGRQAGKIRLQRGVHEGPHRGYGEAHIHAEHGDIESVPQFVADVAQHYNEIWKTRAGKLILTKRIDEKGGRVAVVTLQPNKTGDFYSVITAFVSRKPNGEALLWRGAQPRADDPDHRPALQVSSDKVGGPDQSDKRKEAKLTVEAIDHGGKASVDANARQRGQPQPSIEALAALAVQPGRSGNAAYHVYRKVSEQEIERAKTQGGLDLEGFSHGIDEAAIWHVLNEHGDSVVEAARNQQAVTQDDFALVSQVTDPGKADSVQYGLTTETGLPAIRYQKRINGWIVVVEEVRTGRNRLALKSLWKIRTAPHESSKEDRAPTAKPFRAQSPSGNGIIAQKQEDSPGGEQPAAETGPFGPIFRQFYHDAQGAIEHLKQVQTGEAVAALHHPDVGDIDLVWGEAGKAEKDYEDGYGLAKIAVKHPEVLGDLQGTLSRLSENKTKSTATYRIFEGRDHKAIVRMDWDRRAKTWLLTAYRIEEPPGVGTRAGAAQLDEAARASTRDTQSIATTAPGGKLTSTNSTDDAGDEKRTGGATRTDTDALNGKGDTARLSPSSEPIVGQSGKGDNSGRAKTGILMADEMDPLKARRGRDVKSAPGGISASTGRVEETFLAPSPGASDTSSITPTTPVGKLTSTDFTDDAGDEKRTGGAKRPDTDALNRKGDTARLSPSSEPIVGQSGKGDNSGRAKTGILMADDVSASEKRIESPPDGIPASSSASAAGTNPATPSRASDNESVAPTATRGKPTTNTPEGRDAQEEAPATRFSRAKDAWNSLSADQVRAEVSRLANSLGFEGKLGVEVVTSESDLPAMIQQEIASQGAHGQVAGVYSRGTVYLVAHRLGSAAQVEAVLAEEIFGHHGFARLYGRQARVAARAVFQALGQEGGLRAVAKRHGIDLAEYWDAAKRMDQDSAHMMLVDELLAHLQTKGPQSLPQRIIQALNAFVGAVRESLRRLGLARLAEWGDTDLAYLLVKMRRAALQGSVAGPMLETRPVFGVLTQQGFQRDMAAQVEWLDSEARRLDFPSADELALKAPDRFSSLAKQWREGHARGDRNPPTGERVRLLFSDQQDAAAGDTRESPGVHGLAAADATARPAPSEAFPASIVDRARAFDPATRLSRLSPEEATDPRLADLLAKYSGIEGAPSAAEMAEAVRQYRAVEQQYASLLKAHDEQGKPLPAPNGKPSNLSREQWVLVRTPYFKNWFGNWEHHPETPVAVTQVRADRSAPISADASAWRHYLLEKLRGTQVTIENNGVRVEFFRSGLEASLKNRNALAKAIYHELPSVLRNSVYLGFETNTKTSEKPGVAGYERYVAAVDVNGQIREVLLTVDVIRRFARDRGYYYHQIGEVVVGDVVGNSRALEAPTSPAANLTIGQLPTFGKPMATSQVTDTNGEPLVVYHGTDGPDFSVFRTPALLTDDRDLAEDRAKQRQRGPSRVLSLFARITPDDLASGSEIRDWQDARQFIVSRPEQIKSATGPIGTYLPDTGDIRFSLQPARTLKDLNTQAQEAEQRRLEQAKQYLAEAHPSTPGGKLKEIGKDALTGAYNWTPGALTLRQLAEVSQPYLPQLQGLVDGMQLLQTHRNQMHEDIEALSERWMAMGMETQDQLGWLMNESTIAQWDPTQPNGGMEPFDMAGAKKRIRTLTNLEKNSPGERGDQWRSWVDERENLKTKIKIEEYRQANAREIQAAWEELAAGTGPEVTEWRALDKRQRTPAAWKKLGDRSKAVILYEDARDAYEGMRERMTDALVHRIEQSELPEEVQKASIHQIRLEFESNRVIPYFPLYRRGKYFASAYRFVDGKKQQGFFLYDSVGERRRDLPTLIEQGWTIDKQGAQEKIQDEMNTISERAVADAINEIKQKVGGYEAGRAADALYQVYLQGLHTFSNRVQFIHRKKTPGYRTDQRRAFSYNMMHLAYQVARQEALPTLNAAMAEAEKHTKRLSSGDSHTATRANLLMDEARKRFDWLMNPTGSSTANLASAAGFMWYLGLSPAAGLVNLTQTAMVALPELAGRYGWRAAGGALWKAFRGVMVQRLTHWADRNHFDQWAGLSQEEKQAMQAWKLQGDIDVSQSHMLMGLSEKDSADYDPRVAKALEWGGMLFHEAEVLNRAATLLAGYRLARGQGQDHLQAIQSSAQHSVNAHFDYSNQNRSSWMQHPVAKVLTQFKAYAEHMTYFLGRAAWLSVKGDTSLADGERFSERQQARRRLVGVLGMTGALAGSAGLPLMDVVFGIIDALAAAGGDPDDPWDSETEWRSFLAHFGLLGDVADRGMVNAFAGINLSSRVSLNGLWIRGADRDLGGKGTFAHYTEQVLGPAVGMLAQPFRAWDLLMEGHTGRAIEAVSPKMLRDLERTLRYSGEGAVSLHGTQILPADALGPYSLALQALGFTPDQVATASDTNSMRKLYEKRMDSHRQRLMVAYVMAQETGDTEGAAEAQQAISRYNRSDAGNLYPITGRSLVQSLRTRERLRQESVGGISIKPRLQERLQEVGMEE